MVIGSLALVVVRRVLRQVGLGPAPDAIEIAALRHQLMVVRRQVTRARYTPQDRMVLAKVARLPPRGRWAAFLDTPSTLLRWHRESAGPALDVSGHRTRRMRSGSGDRRSGGADGKGESAVGIRADRGRVPQADHPGFGGLGSADPCAGSGSVRTCRSGVGWVRRLWSGEAEPNLCGGGGRFGAVGVGGQRGSNGLQGLRADKVGPGAFGVGAGLVEQLVQAAPVRGQG
jgi:hypothetical protein